MNERIRELLIEAKEQTKEGKWNAPTSIWAERFAELIVRECGEWCGHDPSGVAAMYKHFGVEE